MKIEIERDEAKALVELLFHHQLHTLVSEDQEVLLNNVRLVVSEKLREV